MYIFTYYKYYTNIIQILYPMFERFTPMFSSIIKSISYIFLVKLHLHLLLVLQTSLYGDCVSLNLALIYDSRISFCLIMCCPLGNETQQNMFSRKQT